MSGEVLRTPRGTRDIFGDEAELFEYLVNTFKAVAKRNGFRPIITPTIEFFDLFARKSGEEIVRSMYVFKDKAGRTLALRPEVTASVVRAYLMHMRYQPKPLLLYYIAQCFRYEEPQRGRYREFWQAGLEVIGEKGMVADLRVFNVIEEFLNEINLKHYYIIGNVGIYRGFMNVFKVPVKDQDHILHLIDKKMFDKAIDYASRYGQEIASIIDALTTLDIDKVTSLINDYRGVLGDSYEKLLNEVEETRKLIELLRSMGFDARYEPSLVRGLAYYTGVIYEVKTETLDISIGGGGRYDNLTTVYDGPPEYSTGAALGIDRIMLALREQGFKVRGSDARVLIAVLSEDPDYIRFAMRICGILHESGVEATIIVGRKLSKVLSLANKLGYRFTGIIGSREFNEQSITLKDMATGVQETRKPGDAADFILKRVCSGAPS